MINFMPIAPIQVLKDNKFEPETHRRKFVMVLAHLCEENSIYANYYKNTVSQRYITLLDNGAAQNSQVTDEQLIQKINLIKPNIVIAPDSIYKGQETITKTLNFINKLKQQKINVKVMAVPHGETKEEYFETFETLYKNTKVNWIGISKFVAIKPFNSRFECVEELMTKYPNLKKSIHLLGCNDPSEAKLANKYSIIKSMDSCIPYLYAYHNQEIPITVDKENRIPTPENFFELELTDKQISLAIKNCHIIQSISETPLEENNN